MKPQAVGIAVFAAFLVRLLLDPGLASFCSSSRFRMSQSACAAHLLRRLFQWRILPPPTD